MDTSSEEYLAGFRDGKQEGFDDGWNALYRELVRHFTSTVKNITLKDFHVSLDKPEVTL